MNFLFFAALMSLPHILYYFIWTQPKKFMELCAKHKKGVDPVECMYQLACTLKIVQFTTYFIFYVQLGALELGNITFFRFLLFLIFAGAGQALNAGIYKAIGKVGVYYGTRLGHKVPWYEGFPFNVCPHPQYVGSVMSFVGLAFLLYNAEHHFPLFYAAGLMAAYYGVTLYVEDHL